MRRPLGCFAEDARKQLPCHSCKATIVYKQEKYFYLYERDAHIIVAFLFFRGRDFHVVLCMAERGRSNVGNYAKWNIAARRKRNTRETRHCLVQDEVSKVRVYE